MAISKNILLNGVTGSINKQIVVRHYKNKIVLSAYPDMSRRKLSGKQKTVNNRMAKANEEVQEIIQDEQRRNAALIRLNVPRNELYYKLIGEYLSNAAKEKI
jgi:hypothetical protein